MLSRDPSDILGVSWFGALESCAVFQRYLSAQQKNIEDVVYINYDALNTFFPLYYTSVQWIACQ